MPPCLDNSLNISVLYELIFQSNLSLKSSHSGLLADESYTLPSLVDLLKTTLFPKGSARASGSSPPPHLGLSPSLFSQAVLQCIVMHLSSSC